MSSRSESDFSERSGTSEDIQFLMSNMSSDSDSSFGDGARLRRQPPMSTRSSQFGNDVRESESVLMGRELRREQITAMFDAETIADERHHLFQFIRQWNINVPEWQGEEPWPLGSDPNENATEALARQRREFADQDNDIRMTSSEVIEMHEPTVEAPEPDPDADSSIHSEAPEIGDEMLHFSDTSSEAEITYPRPSPLTIDPNTGAIDENHFANETAPYAILLDRIQDFAAGRPERDQSIIQDFAYNVSSQIWGDRGPGIARNVTGRWTPCIEQPNPRNEKLLDAQWDEILFHEAETAKWKLHRNAAGILFHQAYLEWKRDSKTDADAFTEHWTNAMKVTSNDACIASILTWFPDLPDTVKSPLARLSRCHHKLAALNHSIETLRYTAMEPNCNTEAAIARWKQYRKSEAFLLGRQLHGHKGRFGYESSSAFRSDYTCYCAACTPLSARLDNKENLGEYVALETGLKIREVRILLAEKECAAKVASHATLDSHRFAVECASRWAETAGIIFRASIEHISRLPEGSFPQEVTRGLWDLERKVQDFRRRCEMLRQGLDDVREPQTENLSPWAQPRRLEQLRRSLADQAA